MPASRATCPRRWWQVEVNSRGRGRRRLHKIIMAYKVTLIPGDGIGPEVTQATVRILEATGVKFDWEIFQAGAEAFDKYQRIHSQGTDRIDRTHRGGTKRASDHAGRRRIPQHQRRAAKEVRAVRQFPADSESAPYSDPLSGRRPDHRPGKYREPVFRNRARSGAGRGREPEDHHRKGLHPHRALRF